MILHHYWFVPPTPLLTLEKQLCASIAQPPFLHLVTIVKVVRYLGVNPST